MSETEFKDKFIGFVDILGFQKIVEASAAGAGLSPSELQELVQKINKAIVPHEVDHIDFTTNENAEPGAPTGAKKPRR